ncbi:hypothetical protein Vretimale_12597 [Volvox reticuliferus]|uniref:Uncharacterized protein n=1 Tax=Volvox reticuliferus TaxID=1737510 RepID=A0A8J4FEZ2_9CHLO|nr:hypothetical protein Vretifemale_234 [Volvox reticuliferus]GIM08575.1 hypothetical protein Vretimale_12597 [Volvox reticuliferus]
MATLQPSGHSPQLVRRASSDRSSRNSSRQVAPFRSYKHGNGNILVNTWITNLKEPAPLPMGFKQEGAAPDDSLPASAEVAAPNAEVGFSRDLSTRASSDDPPNTTYDAADNATLLRKFVVHATSSRRLQGLADAGLMLLALLPTVLLRFIRAAMGLLGITEHRWRGISMVVPLTLEDRTQLEVTVRNLVAGRLGRRPEPPRRGPVSPAQQLFLDVHAILAAATATATAFSLPYDGMAEAALQAKLASYLRGVAADESVCTQDCVKKMRKMARKTLTSLCAAAPTQPAPSAASSASGTAAVLAALRSSSSATHMVTRPKPWAVAKAFMAACLLEQSRSQPDTLIQLVARLPDGEGDLVETMSFVPLAPGAEYLRLLSAAAGDPQQFAEQLEAAVDFGRLRPSDAKKDPAMQGLAINARVHSVGVVRYSALTAAAVATAAPAVDVDGAAAAAMVTLPGQCLALNGKMCTGQGHYSDQMLRVGQQHERVQLQEDMGKQEEKAQDMAPGEEDKSGKDRVTSTATALAEAANGAAPAWAGSASMRQEKAATSWGDGDQRENGGEGSGNGGQRNGATSEMGSVRSDGEGNDTEELLRDVRDATSSQPDLTEPTLSNPASSKRTLGLVLDLAAAASKRALGFVSPTSSKKAITGTRGPMEPDAREVAAAYEAAAAYAAARTNGNGPAAVPVTASSRQQSLRAKPPSFTAASGPSTCITLYPTAALDIFRSVYACPRSGAFAVHGREPRGVGLSRLTAIYSACHAIPAVEQSALLARLGYANLEGLRAEVELRKALCVAQALPVVIASLRLMCGSTLCLRAAHRTGSFLHVQQSLLSDLHRHERGYLEDTKGALDVLADRMVVRFVEGSEKVLPLHVSGSSITVSLPADGVSAAALAEAGLSRASFCAATYGLTTLLFNQGINSLQSLGFLTWRGTAEPLQDSLNRHSLERLNEYAQRANQSGGPHLAALNRHYSPEGRRPAKDTAMFSLVRRACEEVGGGRAVNCKSGKDRTALEISKAMAKEVVAAGLFPASETSWLEGQFLRGLSYVTTSQNHGQPPAYAFNEMEIVTLPPGWRPDWRLCGKVSS